MKLLLILLLAMPTLDALGARGRRVTASGGAPIPTTYSATNNQSLIASEDLGGHSHLTLYNDTESYIACNLNHGSNVVAPGSTVTTAVTDQLVLPPSVGVSMDGSGKVGRVYCRSDSGSAITSGDLILHVW